MFQHFPSLVDDRRVYRCVTCAFFQSLAIVQMVRISSWRCGPLGRWCGRIALLRWVPHCFCPMTAYMSSRTLTRLFKVRSGGSQPSPNRQSSCRRAARLRLQCSLGRFRCQPSRVLRDSGAVAPARPPHLTSTTRLTARFKVQSTRPAAPACA